MTEELALKYRPNEYEEMIGQDAVVRSIKTVVDDKSNRAFCLTGPSGVGKTTLARIVAWDVGCTPENLVEVDGATHTGVDHWRSITEGLRYKPLGGGTKVVIVDEAHMLSRSAWNSLLKIVEEGPQYVWWFFCTTETAKIPATIKTRCACYELDPVSEDDIHDRLEAILAEEEHEVPEEIVALVVRNAGGSVRDAINGLAQVWEASDKREASVVLRTVMEDGDVIDLCRALFKPLSWSKAMALVKPLEGQHAESLRMVIVAYFTKVALGAKSDDAAEPALAVLDAFRDPYPPGTNLAPLLLSLGDLILGE